MVRVQCSKCGAGIFQENYHSDCPCNKCGNKSGAFIDKETRKLMSDSLNENSKEKVMELEIDEEKIIKMANELLKSGKVKIINDSNTKKGWELKIEHPQPTIIKSGDTWIAEYDGVDYLCMIPDKVNVKMENKLSFESGIKICIWKPISEIEITDEIAKLRPMVINSRNELLKLYGVAKKTGYNLILDPLKHNETMNIDFYMGIVHRLATVKDLRS